MLISNFQPEFESGLSELGNSAFENLLIVHLDAHQKVIGSHIQESEATDSIAFPIRRIVADALALETHSVIIAHNHPSGIASPSKNDVRQTRLLEKVLFPLDIELADHLIVADGEGFSFRVAGLL
jgi:DNA repair protein RadC